MSPGYGESRACPYPGLTVTGPLRTRDSLYSGGSLQPGRLDSLYPGHRWLTVPGTRVTQCTRVTTGGSLYPGHRRLPSSPGVGPRCRYVAFYPKGSFFVRIFFHVVIFFCLLFCVQKFRSLLAEEALPRSALHNYTARDASSGSPHRPTDMSPYSPHLRSYILECNTGIYCTYYVIYTQ